MDPNNAFDRVPPLPPIAPPLLTENFSQIDDDYMRSVYAQLHQQRAKWGIGLGLFFQLVLVFGGNLFLSWFASSFGQNPQAGGLTALIWALTLGIISMLFRFYGIVLFIWGCQGYAMSKGQSAGLGYLGIFSVFGLIVIAIVGKKQVIPATWKGYFELPLTSIRVVKHELTD